MTELELLRNIAETAERTRKLQRAYFKHRDPDSLRKSKEAERQLDRLLADRKQPGLFE